MSTNNPENRPHLPSTLRGEHPGDSALRELMKFFHITPPVAPAEKPDQKRPKIDAVGFVRDFKSATHFQELDADLVVTSDPVGFIRKLDDGTEETYMAKLAQERKKGANEAASYGRGRIGKNDVVEVLFNWESMAGTSGRITGEKIKRAAFLAIEEDKPLIIVCPSGGQRQQEGVPALREMLRTVAALNDFKKQTNNILALVLVANTWGGFMASGTGDIVYGIAGSEAGFAGPGVIATFDGKRPEEGSQSVENIADANRGVHVISNNQHELLEHLEQTLDIARTSDQKPGKPKRLHEMSGLDFDQPAIHTPLRHRMFRNHPRVNIPLHHKEINAQSVWDQYQVLSSDPRRPDTLYLLQNAFDGYVPFFSGKAFKDDQGQHLIYPGIIAALAYIDDPRLAKRFTAMIIGNQPSYHTLTNELTGNEGVVKDHASPTSWDFRYELKMMAVAARWKKQLITMGDSFGARARLVDDLQAQYDVIAQCLQAQIEFPYFKMDFLLGVGGSGGHLALDDTTDRVAMLSGAQEFVSVPPAASAIVYKKPTKEDIIRTAETMQPTADFLLKVGLIDKIIQEPEGGAQNHPLQTARLIREDIILAQLEFGHLSPQQVYDRRMERIYNSNAIPIGHLDGKSAEHGHFNLRDWLHT